MKRIGLYIKHDDAAHEKANALEAWLSDRGVDVVRQETSRPQLRNGSPQKSETAPPDLDCIFVLGGDGTFLSASRWIGDAGVPMIGVKFGEVGFLAEVAEDALFEAAQSVLNGNFTIEARPRLNVSVIHDGKATAEEIVLNDVVINKGALARLASIETYVNDHYLTTYRSDGLIVATPTGSTAYSLAAGGPVIHPAVEGIIITPICPFTLTNRPLIVPNSVAIKIRLGEKTSDIVVTFDGQEGQRINSKDTILIEKSRFPLNLIKLSQPHYFDILKAKLHWSGCRI